MAPLLVARALTPVLGLRGQLNLIALGMLICALAAVAIASLVTGLRIRLWAQLLIAAVSWLIMADAAFFLAVPVCPALVLRRRRRPRAAPAPATEVTASAR
jgi:hypothetical protein